MIEQAEKKEEAAKQTGRGPDDQGKQEGEGKLQEDKKGTGNEKKGKPFRPSRKALFITAAVVLVLVGAGFLYWLHVRNFVTTDDAYTTAHLHQISSRVAGTVVEVRADDNQRVHAGEVLVRLDPRDFQVQAQTAGAALQQAVAMAAQDAAGVEQAKSKVTSGDAMVAQARAQMEQSAAQLEKARQDYDRVASLYTSDIRAVSKADVDAATAALDSARGAMGAARANVASAAAQAQAARANLGAAGAEELVSRANVAASQSKLRDAELQLSYCNILAPADGKVSHKTVETGQRLDPGQALMAVVPQDVWVLANLKETQLERVEIGQRVDVKIDTLPHYVFFGHVDSIQEGSGATFSLLPPDNATGNFTKIVQRVPVKIVFDRESVRDFAEKIVPGLSVEPTIDLESLTPSGKGREEKRRKIEEKQNRRWEKENGGKRQ